MTKTRSNQKPVTQPALFQMPPNGQTTRSRNRPPAIYPVADLVERIRAGLDVPDKPAAITLTSASVGVTAQTIAKRIRDGRHLTETQADEWAVACGYHPSHIWPWQ